MIFRGHLLLLVTSMLCIKTTWLEQKVFLCMAEETVVCLFACFSYYARTIFMFIDG